MFRPTHGKFRFGEPKLDLFNGWSVRLPTGFSSYDIEKENITMAAGDWPSIKAKCELR
jgi:hypothetical protein